MGNNTSKSDHEPPTRLRKKKLTPQISAISSANSVELDYAEIRKEQEVWGLNLSARLSAIDMSAEKRVSAGNIALKNDKMLHITNDYKIPVPSAGKRGDLKNEKEKYVPRMQKSVPIANFSRSTKDKIIIGATGLSKTAFDAMQ